MSNKRKRNIIEESDIEEETVVYKPAFAVRDPLMKNNSDGLSTTTEKVETKPKELTPTERMYAKHLSNVINYQKRNPEKMKIKAKKYWVKLKEDKVKYAEYLEKRRIYYNTVIKPKNNILKNTTETL